MSLFQDALKSKKEGNLEKALALFERALKASPEILSQNDEGLIEELKKSREREFALSPGNPKSMEKLAYVYSVCLGEPRRILPFLKKAFEAAIDPMYKKSLQMQIARIEQENVQNEGLQKGSGLENARDVRTREEEAAEAAKLKAEEEAEKKAEAQAERDREEREKQEAVVNARKVLEEKNRVVESQKRESNGELEYCNNAIAINKTRLKECEETTSSLDREYSILERELDMTEKEYSNSPTEANKKKTDEKRKEILAKSKVLIEKQKERDELMKKLEGYRTRKSQAEKKLGISSQE
ncbi:MAG: hypothetical protein HQM08_24455 [Candidatus Riflebacteria bacterium]|nr:hypothetical protein [Candidatus Riflebacteria bacterium]